MWGHKIARKVSLHLPPLSSLFMQSWPEESPSPSWMIGLERLEGGEGGEVEGPSKSAPASHPPSHSQCLCLAVFRPGPLFARLRIAADAKGNEGGHLRKNNLSCSSAAAAAAAAAGTFCIISLPCCTAGSTLQTCRARPTLPSKVVLAGFEYKRIVCVLVRSARTCLQARGFFFFTPRLHLGSKKRGLKKKPLECRPEVEEKSRKKLEVAVFADEKRRRRPSSLYAYMGILLRCLLI